MWPSRRFGVHLELGAQRTGRWRKFGLRGDGSLDVTGAQIWGSLGIGRAVDWSLAQIWAARRWFP